VEGLRGAAGGVAQGTGGGVRVGYCVPVMPELASYRLRVAIPAEHLGCQYAIGCTGRPTFFFKNGNARLAESLAGGVVYDVVNDHFHGKYAADYHGMCGIADKITVASERMAEIVMHNTGRESTVIDDPYETPEQEPRCYGNGVLWFGHSANYSSLLPYLACSESLITCTNTAHADVPWSRENEVLCLSGAAVVLMTGSNPGASANRIVKSLRAGRFVVTPENCADSWRELAPYLWIGDVEEGIRWALNNREEACHKIMQGQQYIEKRFNPMEIGRQWTELFASI
jgi:hypothetical protein